MMAKRILLFYFILTCFGQFTYSQQQTSVVRLEVPAELESNAFHIVTLERDGVLIFYESNEVNDQGQRKWYFALFNTFLKQDWIKFVPLTDQMQFIDSKISGKQVYILFKNSGKSKSNSGFYEIVTFTLRTGEFSKVSGSLPLVTEVTGFEVIGTTACVALNLKKDESDLLFINLLNGDIKPVHVEKGKQCYIESLQVDEKNRHFYAVAKFVGENRYLTDEILRFTIEGDQEKVFLINNTDAIKVLRNLRLDVQGKNKLIVFGTYDINTNRTSTFEDIKNNIDTKSGGLFSLVIENDSPGNLTFFDFMSFNNIYGSLKGREITTSKSFNADEKPSSGKDMTAYYNLIDPQLFKHNNQYILTVEAYRVYYKTETRMEYDFYGNPMPQVYKVFDGYDFYDLIIAGFSEEGKLIWNNDFPLKDLKTQYLNRNATVFADGNFISMAYVNNGKIISQTIDENVDIGDEEVQIETKISRDRITEDENTIITHWYDQFYLVYGYQQIYNKSLSDQSIRTVFFANKVAFQ